MVLLWLPAIQTPLGGSSEKRHYAEEPPLLFKAESLSVLVKLSSRFPGESRLEIGKFTYLILLNEITCSSWFLAGIFGLTHFCKTKMC